MHSKLPFTYRHIHILGASGSGTTTMAKEICSELPFKHFDSDDYFWKVKYTESQPRHVRLSNLKDELDKQPNWVLSGAVIDWGNPLIPLFDLVVFMSVSHEERLMRLKKRESDRFGESILPGGDRYGEFTKFMEWANQYETGGMNVRSRLQQESWLKSLPCEVLRINGDNSPEENLKILIEKIKG
ncbi:MAG: hypothetical protein PQJ59_11235 [Spirochaetales bacterium]|nr:hypothetical protein [Spirochaetales bacterium]